MNLKSFLFAALLAVVATPAMAQAPAPASIEETSAPASAPAAPLSGPRVRSQFRPVEARLIGSPDDAVMYKKKGSETITVSTLVLVLAVVILVLLIT